MKRLHVTRHPMLSGLALGAAVAGAALLAAAPARAGGVTNPAQHPAPVTVTIDGQTYHDGLDTLPGYDDNECTAIPNVQYDFDANKIYYYDDDGSLLASAPWTEWSRISSYQTWQKQHQHSSTPPPPSKPSKPASQPTSKAPTSSRTTATAAPSHAGSGPHSRANHPAGGAASSGATSAGRSGAASTGHAASSAGTTATSSASSASGSTSAAVAVAGGTGSSAGSAPAADAPASGGANTAAAAPVNAQKLAKVVRASIGHGAGNTRFAGVAILLAFVAAGLALLLATTVRRRAFGRRPIRGAHS